MNIIEFVSKNNRKDIVFCIVDDIETYSNSWTKEIIKNIADYTISNLYIKKFNVLVGHDEDTILKKASSLDYKFAVVLSPGTEFINGTKFFDSLNTLISQDFFVAGHILDRGDAYYELHHQCYVINLDYYRKLDFPKVGRQELKSIHVQTIPIRSSENFHDDYTPTWIKPGIEVSQYDHKCHGWNIISKALENNITCIIFDNDIRESKKHHYPESKKDFEKSLPWIYFRNNFCANDFIHTSNTEGNKNFSKKFDQLIIPASGTLYLDLIDEGNVIVYDYNQKSLDYWKEHIQYKEGITYSFIKTDLLVDDNLINNINKTAVSSLVNLSNIFCYEGTAALYPLAYRLSRQNKLVKELKNNLLDVTITFSVKAECGFTDIEEPTLLDLKKPTWHYNRDWI